MRRFFFLFPLFWLLSCTSNAVAQSTVITVGPGASAGLPPRDYTNICTAIANATASTSSDPANYSRIDIDGADSSGNQIVYYDNNCQYGKSIHLRGVGTKKPALDKTPGFVIGGAHAYLRASAGHTTIENIEGRNARCNANCSVFWPETLNVKSITLLNVYFWECDDGFLTANEVMSSELREIVVTVRNSEFAYSGRGDGQTHNFYTGEIHTLIFENNYTHDSYGGQLLKTRAGISYIINNRIGDGWGSGYPFAGGWSNFMGDFPNGGRIFLIGNVVVQGEKTSPPGQPATNQTMFQLCGECPAREAAGAPNIYQELYANANTFISNRLGGAAIALRNHDNAPTELIKNNIFARIATPLMHVNTAQSDPSGNTYCTTIADCNFVDADELNYDLTGSSPGLGSYVSQGLRPPGGGADSMVVDPDEQYAHPQLAIARTPGDHGAREQGVVGTAYIGPVRAEAQTGPQQVTVFFGSALVENTTVTGYLIQRNGSTLTTTASNVKSYVDTTGTPGEPYTYTVTPQGTPAGPLSNGVVSGGGRSASASLGAGTGWHFISQNFANTCSPAGNCTTYWQGARAGVAMDNVHGRYYLWGGDPGSRNSNEVYYFNEATLAWVRHNTTNTMTTGEYDSGGTRPGVRRVVAGLAYLPTQDELFVYGGLLNTGASTSRTWRYAPTTDTWTDHATGFSATIALGSTAYNPNTGKMYVLSNDDTNLREYTPGSSSYAIVKSGFTLSTYWRNLLYDPTHNKLYYIGQAQAGQIGWFDPANSYTYTALTHPVCLANMLEHGDPTMDFDSTTGKIVYWNKREKIIILDPTDDSCTEQIIVGQPSLGAGNPSNGLRYSTALNGFWIARNNDNMAFLRLNEASPPSGGGRRGGGSFSGGGNRR